MGDTGHASVADRHRSPLGHPVRRRRGIIGSPAYMCPSRARYEIDGRAEQYASPLGSSFSPAAVRTQPAGRICSPSQRWRDSDLAMVSPGADSAAASAIRRARRRTERRFRMTRRSRAPRRRLSAAVQRASRPCCHTGSKDAPGRLVLATLAVSLIGAAFAAPDAAAGARAVIVARAALSRTDRDLAARRNLPPPPAGAMAAADSAEQD